MPKFNASLQLSMLGDTTTTGLLPNSCYHLLSDSYMYVTRGSRCFQQECKTTYRTHEPVASNILVKMPLVAQHHSNCTKYMQLYTLITISFTSEQSLFPLGIIVKLYYHMCTRSARRVHTTSSSQHLAGEKFLTQHYANSTPGFLMNSQLNMTLL